MSHPRAKPRNDPSDAKLAVHFVRDEVRSRLYAPSDYGDDVSEVEVLSELNLPPRLPEE